MAQWKHFTRYTLLYMVLFHTWSYTWLKFGKRHQLQGKPNMPVSLEIYSLTGSERIYVGAFLLSLGWDAHPQHEARIHWIARHSSTTFLVLQFSKDPTRHEPITRAWTNQAAAATQATPPAGCLALPAYDARALRDVCPVAWMHRTPSWTWEVGGIPRQAVVWNDCYLDHTPNIFNHLKHS